MRARFTGPGWALAAFVAPLLFVLLAGFVMAAGKPGAVSAGRFTGYVLFVALVPSGFAAVYVWRGRALRGWVVSGATLALGAGSVLLALAFSYSVGPGARAEWIVGANRALSREGFPAAYHAEGRTLRFDASKLGLECDGVISRAEEDPDYRLYWDRLYCTDAHGVRQLEL